MKDYSGGFSKEVANCHIFQGYISGRLTVFGYIGHSNRTKVLDAMVEEALAATGLGPNGIACWLTSNSGRHLADALDKGTTIAAIQRHIDEYTKEAFKDVTIWSHPDHGGSLKSTIELRKRIFGK